MLLGGGLLGMDGNPTGSLLCGIVVSQPERSYRRSWQLGWVVWFQSEGGGRVEPSKGRAMQQGFKSII